MEQTKIKWKKAVERRHPPIFMDFLIVGQRRDYVMKTSGIDFTFANLKKMPFSDTEILGRKWFGTLYFDDNEVAELKKITREELSKRGIEFLKDYADRCYNRANSFLEVSKEISRISDFTILTNKEIIINFKNYAEEAFKMSSFLLTIIGIQFVLEDEIKTNLEEILKSKYEANLIDEVRRKISFPIKKTPEIENMIEIIKLCAEVQKNPVLTYIFNNKTEIIERTLETLDFYQKVNAYVDKFSWMQPMYYRGKPMSIQDAVLLIQASLKKDCIKLLEAIEEKEEKSKKEYKECIKKLKPPEDFRLLLDILQEFLYLRTYRLEIFFIANHFVKNMLEEIAKRLKISYDDVLFLRSDEIISTLEGKVTVPKEIINERKNGYAVLVVNGVAKWYSGKDLLNFISIEPSEVFPENEVKGMIAWPGKVIGSAKCILSNEDMKKIEDGDILITTMTTPSMIPAIQKAGGIVTNEGGVLSHAAIVSREFGIPCIIGTEYATYIFKDNDLLEIYADADSVTGLVRKIL